MDVIGKLSLWIWVMRKIPPLNASIVSVREQLLITIWLEHGLEQTSCRNSEPWQVAGGECATVWPGCSSLLTWAQVRVGWLQQGTASTQLLFSALPNYELHFWLVDTYLRCSWKKKWGQSWRANTKIKRLLRKQHRIVSCNAYLYRHVVMVNSFCLKNQCQAADLISTSIWKVREVTK